MAINIGINTDGDVTYKNPPIDRVLFPNIKEGASLEEIQEAVDAWLDDHPEATTTVEDGSILPVKLDSSNSASDGYVLSYNATAGKFEWYDIGGELDEINSDITDLKQDLQELDVYTLGLYPQMQIEDTAVASFTDGADNIPVKSLTVDVTPVQSGSGDPSPENVRPISGWTGANVTRTGKNMVGGFRTGYAIDGTTGEIITATNANWMSQRMKVGGNQFTVKVIDKGNMTTGSINIAQYRADGSLYDYINLGYFSSTMPITVTYNVASVDSIIIYGYQSGGATAIDTAKFQVEFGSTATDYEPYKGETYEVTFPSSAGTVYGGTLDVTNGVLTVDRANVDMGTLNWSKNGNYGQFVISEFGNAKPPVNNTTVANIISSQYTPDTNENTYARLKDCTISIAADTYMRVYDSRYSSSTGSEFKTAMSGVQLVYELATPVTYQLTPTEVTTLLLNNNIFADTGDIAELTYRADLKAYIDEKLA